MNNTVATDVVRVGVLGCADIAWRRTLPALSAEPLVRVTAIASRQAEKAKKFAERFDSNAVQGYEALLERDDVDAVYIPLPAVLHAEWIEKALLAGKHVLAEKPLTTSLSEAEHLFAVAQRQGRLLMENFMFLHHSQHARIAELVADGAIGDVRSFVCSFTIPPKPDSDIRYQADVGGGALVDIGGYPIRASSLFLGTDLRVAGAVLRKERRRGVVVGGSALLHTEAGVTAQLAFGMEHSYRNTYELHGSTGSITLDRAFTPPATYQPTVHIARQDHREQFTLAADDQFANIVRAFAQSAVDGVGSPQWVDDSLRQAKLVDAVLDKATTVYV